MRPIDDEKRQMTAKEAVNALERIKAEAWDEWIGDCEDYRAFDLAIQALQRSTWIPCSDRLPETESVDDWVKALVCSADGGIAVGSFNSEYGWTFSHWFGEPIAWMPAPEPWKGADDE